MAKLILLFLLLCELNALVRFCVSIHLITQPVDDIQPILVRCYGNHLFVDNYLFTRCIYDISVCKTEILDPKNVENDILHATFGHVVDEIQPTDSDVGHIGFLAQ